MNPGEFKDLIEVLKLNNTNNSFEWIKDKSIWAKTEHLNRVNIFSRVGLSAKSIKFTIRKRALTLHDSLRWKGKHCFLTDIIEIDRMYYEVTAALIEPVVCIINRPEEPTYDDLNRPVYSDPTLITFPGILTEKYLGNIQGQPMTTIETSYILVTPKIIKLQEGELVTIGTVPYEILLAHILDEYKNEYEIVARRDT